MSEPSSSLHLAWDFSLHRARRLTRFGFAAMTGARVALGTIMLTYGIAKLTNIQIELGAWS